jgi:hypothetical protein
MQVWPGGRKVTQDGQELSAARIRSASQAWLIESPPTARAR